MAEPTQLAFRTLKGIGILDASPVYEDVSGFEKPEGNLRCSCYSPDGRFFAYASPEQVVVVDPSVGHIVTTLPAPNVYELGFSPLGTYIITWQRPSKDEEGNAVKNLKVWKTLDSEAGSEGERDVVGKFVQKSQTGWNLQYTSDEKLCARLVTNEVQFYESHDLGTVWNKLREEGVTDFAVAPAESHTVAVFVPERKGMPAAVKAYIVPNFDAVVSQKTFFKGDKVQFKWNSTGTSLIVLAQTDVDKSNRSYYGETTMYILSANGGFDSRIQLDKEGPIHDVSWSPTGNTFGVTYGYMPAKTTIFNTKAVAVHNFPLAPRNTILFSPHGRFVLVAGFGNLAGQCDIYDLTKDYTKVATIEASNASVCEWSPDGRHILTATTSPRLRVDNGVRVWHCLGGLMYKSDMSELYDVMWRPQTTTMHPLEDPINPAPAPHASALAYLGTVKTPSKPAGAYRPPGARGTTTPLHFKREDEGGAAYVNSGISSTSGGSGVNGFGASRRRHVPGAEPADEAGSKLPPGAAPGGGVSLTLSTGEGDENLSKAALKNKKKREARKAREKEASAGGGGSAEGEGDGGERWGRAPNGGSGHLNGNASAPGSRNNSRQRNSSRRRDRKDRSPSRPRTSGRSTTPRPGSRAGGAGGSGGGGGARTREQHQHVGKEPARMKAQNASPTTAKSPSVLAIRTEELSMSPGSGAGTPDTPTSPHEKKLRALTKKLRAIEELKMRQASGEKLELSQESKIRSEEAVRKELEGLGGGG